MPPDFLLLDMIDVCCYLCERITRPISASDDDHEFIQEANSHIVQSTLTLPELMAINRAPEIRVPDISQIPNDGTDRLRTRKGGENCQEQSVARVSGSSKSDSFLS